MTKEKQIKEMAKVINKRCIDIFNDQCLLVDECPFPYTCEECTARQLYKAGYRKQSEWISVEERLPPAGKGVLVCFDHFVSIDFMRSDGQWNTFNADSSKCVTHWAPIPKMPFPKISIPRVSEDDEKGGEEE